jgi:hypothetical protein
MTDSLLPLPTFLSRINIAICRRVTGPRHGIADRI